MKRNKNLSDLEDIGFYIAMSAFSFVVGLAIIAFVGKIVMVIAN